VRYFKLAGNGTA